MYPLKCVHLRDVRSSSVRAKARPATINTKIIAHSLLMLILATFINLTEQLKFSAVQIPAMVQRNTNYWLSCQIELDQLKQDQLYSVKWYKNNEEFYRLLLASDPVAQEPEMSGGSGNQQQQQQQQQQQSYFAQAGVNVLMSSSNATHVRLLNASLESEGVYACEISTQNLSTIRYEKEIRVYVLPQNRLSVIGFRNRYALGDKVDLICSSDFSRPKPALAWFINGQRIRQSNSWFEQELDSRSKLNEASLFKLNLRLSFKLSADFLATIMASKHQQQLTNQRNQSQAAARQQQPAFGGGASGGQLLEKLELQCRYRLTEISDVTYNELALASSQLVSQSTIGGGLPPPTVEAAGSGALDAADWPPPPHAASSEDNGDDDGSERKKRMSHSGVSRGSTPIRTQKSPDGNQVIQSKSPAEAGELRRSIMTQSSSQPFGGREHSCKLGSLTLSPDDPMLAQPTASVSAGSKRVGSSSGEELLQMIRVNCSTISAIVDDARQQDWMQHTAAAGQRASTAPDPNNNIAPPPYNEPSFCGNQAARRRSLVSGKGMLLADNEPPQPMSAVARPNQRIRPPASGGPNNNKPQVVGATRQLYAYLSLAQFSSTGAPQRSVGPNNGDVFSSDGDNTLDAGDEMPSLQRYRSQFASMATTTTTTNADSSDSSLPPRPPDDGGGSKTPVAPPLLEWFINNQEAPRASASYSPELPHLKPTAPASEFRVTEQLTSMTEDVGAVYNRARNKAADAELAAEVLPPIDYADYFANFDSRPVKQHLMLSFKPDKKHFMTPDSKLRLRCSSTQAQVLATDLISLSIVTSSSNSAALQPTAPGGHGWQSSKARLAKQNAASNQARASRVSSMSQQQQHQPSGSGSLYRLESPSIELVALSITFAMLHLFA